jgi:hypothetical protein
MDVDFWELESGEQRHADSPDSFWIPPRSERTSLRVGQAAKLLFAIEADDNGQVIVSVERMWVFVREVLDGGDYIGILDSVPASFDPTPDMYLALGVEIPFRAEHVIDIANPPQDYVQWQLTQPPERFWPRD